MDLTSTTVYTTDVTVEFWRGEEAATSDPVTQNCISGELPL